MTNNKWKDDSLPPYRPDLASDEDNEKLAMAIVQDAAEEYMIMYRRKYRVQDPAKSHSSFVDEKLKEDTEFFESDYFTVLTKGEVNPYTLMLRLQDLAMNTNKRSFGSFH